jgi:hypothetical protein
MGVQNLMSEAVCIPDGDSPHIAITGIYYNACYWRVQHWIAFVDPRLSDGELKSTPLCGIVEGGRLPCSTPAPKAPGLVV